MSATSSNGIEGATLQTTVTTTIIISLELLPRSNPSRQSAYVKANEFEKQNYKWFKFDYFDQSIFTSTV